MLLRPRIRDSSLSHREHPRRQLRRLQLDLKQINVYFDMDTRFGSFLLRRRDRSVGARGAAQRRVEAECVRAR